MRTLRAEDDKSEIMLNKKLKHWSLFCFGLLTSMLVYITMSFIFYYWGFHVLIGIPFAWIIGVAYAISYIKWAKKTLR